MRLSFALKNTVASILVEIITAVSGIILPKFFISVYGSSVNGLVSSIGQFITYMGLVEAGVGAAATVELYKPLAENDHSRINTILSAAKSFYIRSGTIFIVLDILLIIGYPFIVQNEIADEAFVRMMIIVLSLSGIVDYFILGKYRVLLTADQKIYIISFAQAVGTLVTLVISVILIVFKCSPILVKAVVAFVYLLRTLYIVYYVRNNYKYISFNSSFSEDVFPQRKSALFHQIIGMICNNTDVVLLTVMLQNGALVEVSVYAVYNMVASNLTSLFNSFSKGLTATFGNIIASDDRETLKKSFSYFELLYLVCLYIVYTCMGVLLYSFISLYSGSFQDAEIYQRWSLVILFTACGLVQNIRIPGMTVQLAYGHYKQTQGAALLEAIINFGVSVALVGKYGINGVLIGTLAAYLYRSTYVILYNAHHFLSDSLKTSIHRIIRNGILYGDLITMGILYLVPHIKSWISWITCACILFGASSGSFLLLNYLFEPTIIRECYSFLRKSMKNR